MGGGADAFYENELLLARTRAKPLTIRITAPTLQTIVRRNIERWTAEAANADAAGFPSIANEVRGWISEASRFAGLH